MIKYNPTHYKYESDANVRPATQHNQATRDKINYYEKVKIGSPLAEKVQMSNFL